MGGCPLSTSSASGDQLRAVTPPTGMQPLLLPGIFMALQLEATSKPQLDDNTVSICLSEFHRLDSRTPDLIFPFCLEVELPAEAPCEEQDWEVPLYC